MISLIRRALYLALVFATALGCSPPGPPMGIVDGTVLLDGKPLPDGTISFFSVDQSKPPAAGTIVDGRFRVEVPTGPVRVTLHSVEIIRPAQLPEDEGDARERVPPQYNAASQLRLEVVPGDNPVTYELTSFSKGR